MKKTIRPVLSIILTVCFVLSIIPSVGTAKVVFDANVKSSALTDGKELYCVAKLTNTSSIEGEITVLKAVYNSDGTQKSAEKEKVELDKGQSLNKEISLAYDGKSGESAEIFFWKGDTMQPLCESILSTDVPEGPIDEGEIEITENMVFASTEAESNHRVTAIADKSAETYWSAKGVARGSEASVTADLEYDHMIKRVGVQFGLGSERGYIFTVSTSEDGNNYTEVLGETESARSDDMQYFSLLPSVGRFLRVTIVERCESDENNWVQIAEIEAFGTLLPVDTGDTIQMFTFDDAVGTKLDYDGVDNVADSWFVRSMNEENYKDYTPSRGAKLYGEVNTLPNEATETALKLVDYVGRATDEANGAGGIMAMHRIETNSNKGKYEIEFDMLIPSVMANGEKSDTFWSGFSLTDEIVSGGADLSHYAAMQIRFEDTGNNGVKLKYLTSNQYNEGSLMDFMGTEFKKDALWNVTLKVDPQARRVDVAVTDGVNYEEKPLYFSYNNAEKTRPSQWSGLEAKYLVFNTGAGKSVEMYVDDVYVTHFEAEAFSAVETVLASIDMSENNNGNMEFKNIADNNGDEAYEGSLGEKLYVEITDAPTDSTIEGKALHLYDEVGRVTDEVNGAGGAMAYVSFPTPNTGNAYRVDFKLHAPVADEYGGFSLSNGIDGSYGMQLRFAKSTASDNNESGENLKLKKYTGNTFNGGNYEDLVGGYTAITKGNTWDISIVINPTRYESEITIDDGVNAQTRTVAMATTYENWVGKELNTLAINSGIGGFADIYIGDIVVTDLGKTSNVKSAINGMFRLVAAHGTGNMLHHQGNEVSDFAEQQDPAYTRFVERSGLMDPDGVSFEVANRPGYFLTIVPGTTNQVQVQPFSNTARFKANATFIKRDGVLDVKGYGKDTVSYAAYRDRSKYLYNDSGNTVVWSRRSRERTIFYQRNEASASRVSDNFKGTSLDKSKWQPQYAWGDTHNHLGLCRESAIEVKDGIITLKANKIPDDSWPKSNSGKDSGQTGIDLSSYKFNNWTKWHKWDAYVGVITPHKNYNGYDSSVIYKRQSYLEGSFKQPNAGYGFWTAFWLSGASSWPPETDIFEYLSSSGSAGAHGWYTNMHESSSSSQGNWYYGSNLRTQFHTYALDWGYDYMDMYYDGKLFKRYTGSIVAAQNSGSGAVVVINTGVGGWEDSLPSEYGIGMSLEWFRSYQY